MKKLLIILAIVTLTSCEKDEIKDCNCDKIVNTNYMQFNIPGAGTVYSGSFTTVNQCTEETKLKISNTLKSKQA